MSWLPKPPTKKELYDMNMHDRYYWDIRDSSFNMSVLKVPGGWIYTHHGSSSGTSAVFVKQDDEYWEESVENEDE